MQTKRRLFKVKARRLLFFSGRLLITLFFFFTKGNIALAQCPANIDFETGTFNGWTLYTGTVSDANGQNNISLTAGAGNCVMLSDPPGNGLDYYGGFPVNCPNGSGHSIKLGDSQSGAQAEGLSYEFTIPVGQNTFSLTYYYAVVLQSPNHPPQQQPRLDIEVQVNGSSANCSTFSYISGGGLPGFVTSPKNNTVLYRDWSASSINLDNMAGSTIKIFFKTADCTPGGHFGYAYIDVDTKCENVFPGSSFCPGDTSVDVVAPIGYQQYNWHYPNSSQVLGTRQTLHIAPAPPAGTAVIVDVQSYPGYGCSATYSVNLVDDLIVVADAGPDRTQCTSDSVQIGVFPVAGIVYSWAPITGLSNPHIANPKVSVNSTTTYTLTAKSGGGGCVVTDQVDVYKVTLDKSITLIGPSPHCEGVGQTILQVNPADHIQWFKDGIAIPGENQTQYIVTQTGDYKAEISSLLGSGCAVTTAVKTVLVYPTPVVSGGVDNAIQCYPGNNFVFTGAATVTTGVATYLWDFGDGKTANTSNAEHKYTYPGTYNVKLTATGPSGGCSDDTSIVITVKPGAIADFTTKPVCIDLVVPLVNNTDAPGANIINYLWDFGNTYVSTLQRPTYIYTVPGTYTITLSTSTPECPQPTIKQITIAVDEPTANLRYQDQLAIIDFPEQLTARPIGKTAFWSPPVFLSNPTIYKPYYRGSADQLYTIDLTTVSGCVTTDTLLVKPYKKVAINMPTAFTPNGDGKNDLLRPMLFGFKKINYFRIFNRWGKMIYQTQKEWEGWDGTINGIKQDTQTYIWMIEAVDVDGKVHTEKGTIILIR